MKNKFFHSLLTAIVLVSITVGYSVGVSACSRVFWNDNGLAMLSVRTWDLYFDDKPVVVVSPRGIERNGKVEDNTKSWVSKYANVAVNNFGSSDATSDGMNEKGLAGHVLYLDKTKYEPRNNKPGLTYGVILQYLLDNAATVSEALELMEGVQVVAVKLADQIWPLHIAIEDAFGDSAILEWIDGSLKIYHGKQYTVMTNEPALDEQLKNLPQYAYFNGVLPLPGDIDPQSRFVRAAAYLKTLPKPTDLKQAKMYLNGIIVNVSIPWGAADTSANHSTDVWPTLWRTAYDLNHLTMEFHHVTTGNSLSVDLNQMDLNKGAAVRTMDPQSPQ